MDGLFVRMKRPTRNETAEPNSYYSGHKRRFGMNVQGVCTAQYKIIAWTLNCPGRQNDRTAFKFSGIRLPTVCSCCTLARSCLTARMHTTTASLSAGWSSSRPSEYW